MAVLPVYVKVTSLSALRLRLPYDGTLHCNTLIFGITSCYLFRFIVS
jgi:hypothetical protein